MFDSSDKISDVSELNSASGFPTLLFERLSCLHSWRFPSFVQYIALDGDSLTTEDLVSLGKGHYKIKVCWREGGKGHPLNFFAARVNL